MQLVQRFLWRSKEPFTQRIMHRRGGKVEDFLAGRHDQIDAEFLHGSRNPTTESCPFLPRGGVAMVPDIK
ncbi:hypothetical protein MACH24_10640 [Erythrobacter sp. Dej080120_24]|nr:hypothetical protein MACH24_10640 [Erythrobacter sp. Dej080120_24]